MFCPRCGREQASTEVRFCNGCGFPLSDVAEALGNEGLVNRDAGPAARDLKKNVSKALAVMTLSAVFFILSLILGTPEPSYFVQFNMLVGILCYVFALAWIVLAFWKNSKGGGRHPDGEGRQLPEVSQSVEGDQRKPARQLSEPELSAFVGGGVPSVDRLKTNDLVERPQSVTEGTTRLLEKDLWWRRRHTEHRPP